MATSFIILVVLSFLAVSTWSSYTVLGLPDGVSGLCWKTRLRPSMNIVIPEACCDERGTCEDYIEPLETKHGLTNPETLYPRRLCSCDEKFYECVTKDMDLEKKSYARNHGFIGETCFRRHSIYDNGMEVWSGRWEFVSFLSTLVNQNQNEHGYEVVEI